jgi:hypothetical protein
VLKKKNKKIIGHGSAPKKFIYLGPSPSNFLDPSLGEMSKYENLGWIT